MIYLELNVQATKNDLIDAIDLFRFVSKATLMMKYLTTKGFSRAVVRYKSSRKQIVKIFVLHLLHPFSALFNS